MSAVSDSLKTDLAYSSLWGVGRGVTVQLFIYPLEVVKIRQQCGNISEKSYHVALTLFQKEGALAFYKGLTSQLTKTCLKQIWCWPMITHFPVLLNRYEVKSYHQALTGLAIATIDAGVTTPLEKLKVIRALNENKGLVPDKLTCDNLRNFSFKYLIKEGYSGFPVHWSKLSISWSTFLVVQKSLRDTYSQESQKPLNLSQMISIGVQTAMVVSVVSAPFDVANTLKQARNRNLMQLFTGDILRKLYRGWPLSALSLTVNNVASVVVLNKLEKK